MTDTALIPSAWDVVDGVVPLAQVRKSAGLSADAVVRAVKGGHLSIVDRSGMGRGGAYRVDLETALLVLAAGVLCATMGLAFLAALRILRNGDGKITPEGVTLTIPLRLQG